MSIRDHLPTLIAAAMLGNAVAALGQTNTNGELKSTFGLWAGAYERNFTHWKGVVIHCSHQVKSVELDKICGNAYASAKYLVAGKKVDLEVIRDGYAALIAAGDGEYLSLGVELYSTKQGSPAAILASIRAYTMVLGGVETHPQAAKESNPRHKPRAATMIFWEREVIGTSANDPSQLTEDISKGIHRHLEEFVTAFVDARK